MPHLARSTRRDRVALRRLNSNCRKHRRRRRWRLCFAATHFVDVERQCADDAWLEASLPRWHNAAASELDLLLDLLARSTVEPQIVLQAWRAHAAVAGAAWAVADGALLLIHQSAALGATRVGLESLARRRDRDDVFGDISDLVRR